MDVGVVGCGTMGSGICETAARGGHRVVFVEADATRRDAGMARIEKWLSRAERRPWLHPSREKLSVAHLRVAS